MAPGTGTATGCYKCGRPGHWSRDCPSSASLPSQDAPIPTPNPSSSSTAAHQPSWKNSKPLSKPSKPVLPRKRPKLTPDLLLSNEGLGYVLEHFPRMVKIQGPGHEVDDLKNFLESYVHWHSRILPYFSFDQFVERIEKLGSTRRVRICLNDLKKKVAMDEDLKLNCDGKNPDETKGDDCESLENNILNENKETEACEDYQDGELPENVNEDMFDEFYKQAVEEPKLSKDFVEPSARLESEPVASVAFSANSEATDVPSSSLNEDQRLRMEANRIKALERAKARAAAAAAVAS